MASVLQNVCDDTVLLHVTHSNLKQHFSEIRFSLHVGIPIPLSSSSLADWVSVLLEFIVLAVHVWRLFKWYTVKHTWKLTSMYAIRI